MPRLVVFALGGMFLFLLTSCGGGGGGSGSPVVTYSGLLTQAALTAENAMEFSAFLLGEGAIPLPPTDEVVADPAMLAAVRTVRGVLSEAVSPAVLTTDEVKFSGSFPGSVSGTVSYSGTLYTDFTATIRFNYLNFNDGDGYTYDGKLTVRAFNYDLAYDDFLAYEFSTLGLEIAWVDGQLTLAGDAALTENVSQPLENVETMVMNFDGLDGSTGKTFRLENLQSVMACDISTWPPAVCSEEISGRIYLHDEGYVDLGQDAPLVYNYMNRFNVDVPDAGGPVYLLGAGNTREKIEPTSIVRVAISVDADGDGQFELNETYAWTDLVDIVYSFEVALGTVSFDIANDGVETVDDGYLAVGWSNTMSENGLDGYLMKVNAAGELEWSKGYGGAGDQEFQAVTRTRDGGYAMIGTSTSTNIPPVDYLYVVKIDGDGVEQWSQTRVGANGDISSNGFAILENPDGSLMIAGSAYGWGPYTGYVEGYLGFEDIYFAKLDADGELLWEKRLGGEGWDYAYALTRTGDGGYVLAGTTDSFDYSALGEELYLLKTDADGDLLWEKHFDADAGSAAPLTQHGHDVVEDANGNLIAVGLSATLSSGTFPYVVKVTAGGELLWDRLLADQSLLTLKSIDLTTTGNYVLAGNGTHDVYLLELSSDNGALDWSRTFNWTNYTVFCTANAVQTTSDGGYVLFGSAWPSEGKDVYIIKTDARGELWRPY